MSHYVHYPTLRAKQGIGGAAIGVQEAANNRLLEPYSGTSRAYSTSLDHSTCAQTDPHPGGHTPHQDINGSHPNVGAIFGEIVLRSPIGE